MASRTPSGRSADLPLRSGGTVREARPGPREQQRTGRTPAAQSVARGEIVRAIQAVGRGFTAALTVPGKHYSGLSYDELLDVLEQQGRDFRATTPTMRKAVLAAVTARLENARAMPTETAIREALADEALAWIVKRFVGKVRDEHLRQLSLRYARAKARDGYGGEPIGTRTGALASRVEDFGRVTLS